MQMMAYDTLVDILAPVNFAGLSGLCFMAGRYVQRLTDAEKSISTIEAEKNEVNHAVLAANIEHLSDSIEQLQKEVSWLAKSMALRNNQAKGHGE